MERSDTSVLASSRPCPHLPEASLFLGEDPCGERQPRAMLNLNSKKPFAAAVPHPERGDLLAAQAFVAGAGGRFPPPSVSFFCSPSSVPAGANLPGAPTLGKLIWMGCHIHSRPVFHLTGEPWHPHNAWTRMVVSALCLGLFG